MSNKETPLIGAQINQATTYAIGFSGQDCDYFLMGPNFNSLLGKDCFIKISKLRLK